MGLAKVMNMVLTETSPGGRKRTGSGIGDCYFWAKYPIINRQVVMRGEKLHTLTIDKGSHSRSTYHEQTILGVSPIPIRGTSHKCMY